MKNAWSGKKIYAKWCSDFNVGDALNPILVKEISGVYPNPIKGQASNVSGEVFVVIGSVLGWMTDSNDTVWGAGFISSKEKLRVPPRKICAVRGPLTRGRLIEQGVDCPEVYGDPALLLPRFYNPAVAKTHTLGIIPHYIDQGSEHLQRFKDDPGVLIIDVTSNYRKFVQQIKSCERIASSSLHGIILADAYGVPATWIELSDKVDGDGFKFRDYFLSVGREDKEPLIVDSETTLDDIHGRFYDYSINIDLDKLLQACPFRNA